MRRITLEINLDGGRRTAADVQNITERFEELQAQMRALQGVSQQLGTSLEDTEALLGGLGIDAARASEAINGLLLEQQGLREIGSTIRDLGLTQTQADVLSNVLGNPGDIQNYIELLNGLDSELDSISQVASIIGGSIREAEQFIEELGLSADTTAEALRRIQAGRNAGAGDRDIRSSLGDLDINEGQIDSLLGRIDSGLGRTNQGAGNLIQRIGLLSLSFNQALQAIQTFAAAGGKAYDALIGQNERLRQEILGVQSSLAANTDVFQGDRLIEDPKEAILALQAPVKEALRSIEEDSLELVGVTSSDLTQVFSILTQQTEAISNQSDTLSDPIEAASKLTIDFAATLGTLGVPLNQARQEINSILTAQIDQNSVLAKSLGITSDQVRQYKQQGELVDFLRGRLEPFVEGNALAAKSVSGITSNLQEVFEIVTRTAGEPLYDDIIEQLELIYNFVQDNQDEIAAGVQGAVAFVQELLDVVLQGIAGLAEKLLPLAEDTKSTLEEIAETGAEQLLQLVELFFAAINGIVGALEPLLTLLGKVLQVMNDFGLTEVITQGAIIVATLAALDVALAAIAATLFTSVIPAAIATAVAIAPLIPLLLAVGIAAAGFEGFKLGKVNEAIDLYSASVKQAGDESFKYAVQLKNLNRIEEEGGILTAEQVAQKKNLISISQSQIEQNKAQIEELKKVKAENTSQENSIKALIQQLEISNNALEKQAGLLDGVADKVRVQSKALLELGTAYDQINQKIQGNLEAIQRGTGDLIQIQKQAQETIDLTQKQFDAGVTFAEQAIANLQIIADNTKLGFEQQLAASKAIFDILTKEVTEFNEYVKTKENERLIGLQEQLNNQLITEGEFNRRKADLTTQRIKLELQAETERIQRIQALDIPEEVKQVEIRKAQAKTTELQLQLIQQEKAEREAIFSLLTERVEKFNEEVKQAERERLIDLQKLLNDQLITEGEFNERKANLTSKRIRDELAAELNRIKEIEALDIPEEAKQEETRKAQAKTTELQLQLLQQEKAERESLVGLVREREQLAVAAARRETSLIVSGLKDQQDAYEEINRQLGKQKTAQEVILRNLETETKLVNSIAEVEGARRNLANIEGDLESDRITKVIALRKRLKEADIQDFDQRREITLELQRLDGFSATSTRSLENDLKRLDREKFRRRVAAQRAEEDRARVLLELDLQRNEATAKRSVLEAKIAENQARQAVVAAEISARQATDTVREAQGNLEGAIASGNKEDIANAEDKLRLATEDRDRQIESVDLAKEGVDLAKDNVTEANKQVAVQEVLAQNSRTVLDLQQQAADAQLRAEARARGQANELERGANQAIRMANALNSIQTGIGVIDGQLVTVEGRKMGGKMDAGTPYVVGEGVGGRFIPGVSEIIVPNTDSFAIASGKATEIFNQGQQIQSTNSIAEGHQQLLDTARSLKQEIQGLRNDILNMDTTSIEGAQIINQFTNPDEKQLGMKFARDFLDELARKL